jgi:hypothetical protein
VPYAGTITLTAPDGTGITYSIDGADYTNTTGIFTNVAAATYSVTVKMLQDVSLPTSVTINNQQHLLHQLPLQQTNVCRSNWNDNRDSPTGEGIT